jgi:glycosyltransferase involved in cell wall biosynthesis
MKLQILIPQYKETDEVVKPLLDSIALQQNVPFDEIGVIICNDGSGVYLSNELLNSYPFKVEYYKEPHRGVSATRNACLDHATADYVMFCDADDMFKASLLSQFKSAQYWSSFSSHIVGLTDEEIAELDANN